MSDIPVVHYNQNGATKEIKGKWWASDIKDDERHMHIFGVVTRIQEGQGYRSNNNLKFAQLYHNVEMMGLAPGLFSRSNQQKNFLSNRVTYNVIRSCIDTAASKIAKSKPRPMFLTNEGDWEMKERAEGLTDYCDGMFDDGEFYENARRAFIDAGIFGTGVVKLYRQGFRIKSERVISEEMIVDDTEGMYGKPRQMHQVKNVFREVLLDLFGEKHEHFILAADRSIVPEHDSKTSADMVRVIESWHLPSGEGTGDGRHTISIDGCTLLDEEYCKDYFPFVFFRWAQPVLGFYGTGIAEQLVGIQLEINKLLRTIQIAQHLMAVPQIWLNKESEVVRSHINNEVGGVKYYVGERPYFMVPQAMSGEIYQHLENLWNKAFADVGISAMSARSEKPAGITASVAMQTLSDIESERFMLVSQQYEEMHLEMARIGIDMTRDMYKEILESEDDDDDDDESEKKTKKQLLVKSPSGAYMRKVNWKDVDMEEDSYVIRCFPTNLLPTQPPAKLQKIQEYLQGGLFDREQAVALMDFPDTNAETKMITAPRDDIKRMITDMLKHGKYEAPEPFMNLQLALKMTQSAYLRGRADRAPDSRLELLRRFMNEIESTLFPEPEPTQDMGAGAPMPVDPMAPGAIGQPAPAPVSELMPIDPAAVGGVV